MPGIEDIRLASANDPMDDKNQIALQLFGKPLDQLNEDEIIETDWIMMETVICRIQWVTIYFHSELR